MSKLRNRLWVLVSMRLARRLLNRSENCLDLRSGLHHLVKKENLTMKRLTFGTLASLMLIAFLGAMPKISFARADTWTKKKEMPTKRATFATGVIDGKIYAVGGWKVWADPRSSLATLEIYDPATDTWEKGPDMPTPRGGLVAAVVDGVLYAITGGQIRQGLPAVEVYDPAIGTWKKRAHIPIGKYTGAASVVDGKIYVIGGWPGTQLVQMYDLAADTWTQKASMLIGRGAVAAAAVDGKIYAIGGETGFANPTAILEMYDPAIDTWTRKADMPTARAGVSTAVVNGLIYAIGGTFGPRARGLATVEVYDPITDTWAEKPDMPTPRSFTSTSVVNGKIYVIGGSAMSVLPIVPLSTVEVFDTGFRELAVSPRGKLATTWGEIKRPNWD